jgi:hypothetical protein
LAARPAYFQVGGDALVALAIVAIWCRLIWPPHLARYPELPPRGRDLLVNAVLLFGRSLRPRRAEQPKPLGTPL